MADRLEGSAGIGLMGGTFDPIHLAHLVTAEATAEQFSLERIVFVPAGEPPHKKGQAVTPAYHRHNMVILATASNHRFEVSRVELDQTGPSYTVDTLEWFHARYPSRRLFFITGADAITTIGTWRDPGRLFKLATFIAVGRPGFAPDGVEDRLRELERTFKGPILRVDAPALDISSTDIRDRVRRRRSIKYLVPQPVEDYIREQCLYQTPADDPQSGGLGRESLL